MLKLKGQILIPRNVGKQPYRYTFSKKIKVINNFSMFLKHFYSEVHII